MNDVWSFITNQYGDQYVSLSVWAQLVNRFPFFIQNTESQ